MSTLLHRWPHDHWFVLWLSFGFAWLSVFLHVDLPWNGHPLSSLIASFSLLMLPGAVLLRLLAPSSDMPAQTEFSKSYRIWRIIGWILTSGSLVGVSVSWFYQHVGLMSLHLGVLCLAQWIPELQERVIRTAQATWILGFPIQAQRHDESDHTDTIQDSFVMGQPLHRGRWRNIAFIGLWLGWTGVLWQANQGATAKLPGFWSVSTILVWLLGGSLCFAISRCPPTWKRPRRSVLLWHESSTVQRVFLYGALPACLWTVAISLYSVGYQLWFVSPLDFSYRMLSYDLVLALGATILGFDPSGIYAWIVQSNQNQIWVRRYGWIETFSPTTG